jgi:hypothetical protein
MSGCVPLGVVKGACGLPDGSWSSGSGEAADSTWCAARRRARCLGQAARKELTIDKHMLRSRYLAPLYVSEATEAICLISIMNFAAD